MLTLYSIPGSSAAAPRIALDEAGADYALVEVKRDDAGNNISPADYAALKPQHAASTSQRSTPTPL